MIGDKIDGYVGIVEQIHISCIVTGKYGKSKQSTIIPPCCLLDLDNVSVIIFVEKTMSTIEIPALSKNLKSSESLPLVLPSENELRKAWQCKCTIAQAINLKEKLYEIERLMAYKVEKGTAWWYVKWRNFDEKFNSWEPDIELQSCVSDRGWKELVQKFQAHIPTDSRDWNSQGNEAGMTGATSKATRTRRPRVDVNMVRW